MIVSCPSCATRYLVDPTALGETGRIVRCARCAHTWMEIPPDDMPLRVDVTIAPSEPRPIPPGSNLPALSRPPRKSGWQGWAALAVVIVVMLGGAFLARDRIIEGWPLAERLYAVVGLAETAPALQVRNLKQWAFVENEKTVYVFSGEIVNLSDQTRAVPNLVAQIFDKDWRVVKKRWVFAPPRPRLGPAEATEFSGRFSDPPKGGANLMVSLDGNG